MSDTLNFMNDFNENSISMNTGGLRLVPAAAVLGGDDAGGAVRQIDLGRIERAVREILVAIGEDPGRDGLRETPKRVARAYQQVFGGLGRNPREQLARVFEQPCDGAVVVRDIAFYSMCEHHLLPFFGRAHVAYRPAGDRVVGLSKIARTVETFAQRPHVQERLTAQVADALHKYVEPLGAAVVVEATHLCMAMRGVAKADSATVTTAVRGIYETDATARSEIMRLLGSGR